MQFISEILKYAKRYIPTLDSKEGIYLFFNPDNNYPEKILYLAENSVTTSSAWQMMSKFVAGLGVPELNAVKVNEKQTLLELINDIARNLSLYNGFYIISDFDANGNTFNYQIKPFKNFRVYKKDDNGYNAKYLYSDDFLNKDIKPTELWGWNTDNDVILRRLKNDKINGMVYYHSNDNRYIYPISRIHSVIQDAESEIYVGTYKNKTLKGGFVGKKIFIMPDLTNGLDQTSPLYVERKKRQDEIKQNLTKFLGVDNIDNIMLLNVGIDEIEMLEKSFIVKDIKSDLNPDVFSGIENTIRDNIRMAFNNIPEMLIRNTDNSLFLQSGESFKQAVSFYNGQTQTERELIGKVLTNVFKTARNKDLRRVIQIERLKQITDDSDNND